MNCGISLRRINYLPARMAVNKGPSREVFSSLFVNTVIFPALNTMADAGPAICKQPTFAKSLIANLFTDRR
jgi:hypothetical protein